MLFLGVFLASIASLLISNWTFAVRLASFGQPIDSERVEIVKYRLGKIEFRIDDKSVLTEESKSVVDSTTIFCLSCYNPDNPLIPATIDAVWRCWFDSNSYTVQIGDEFVGASVIDPPVANNSAVVLDTSWKMPQ